MLGLNSDTIKILDMGISLTTEKDYTKLLELILETSMNITSCDAGTLFMYENNSLRFKVIKNNTLNIYNGHQGEEIDFPPVPLKEENICAYSFMNRKVINISDVTNVDFFDFSGPQKYDSITGYKTISMLVIPLENHENEVLGVIQLLNAKDENGNVIPFKEKYEYVMFSIASQAAVSLSNMKYLKESKDLLYAFVSVMATAIDERSPYNANHTKNVALYTEKFINYLNEQYFNGNIDEYFDENRKEQLILAARLHDIGKLVIPLEIMNKATKLENHIDDITNRFSLIKAYLKIDYLENRISNEEYEKEINYIEESFSKINELNTASFLTLESENIIRVISEKEYTSADGTVIKYITPYEKNCLLIKKGTLTQEERKIMESHVEITTKLLNKIDFNRFYKNIPLIAGSHHEYLDGSGYPNKLKDDSITFDMRILIIIDIFEALTSKDRPYKKKITMETAFNILYSMSDEGKLDRNIIKLLQNYCNENGTL